MLSPLSIAHNGKSKSKRSITNLIVFVNIVKFIYVYLSICLFICFFYHAFDRLKIYIVGKHDMIHDTGSTYHIVTPPEEDRAAITINNYRKFGEVWSCSFRDIQADRQTNRHTTHHITSHPSRGGRTNYSKKFFEHKMREIVKMQCNRTANNTVRN